MTLPPDGPPANVLLVDDEPANLLALEAVLHDLGPNLVRAGSGEEALRRLLRDDFAVVLLDVVMPGLGGLETARLIRGRERSRHTPIIFVTGRDSSDFTVGQAYMLGAVDFLAKPVEPAVLRAKVAVFVELFQKARQVERQAEQLRRAQLERAERRTLAQYVAAGLLAESASLADAAPKLLRSACENLGWDAGALWTVDAPAGVLRCAEFWHAPAFVAAAFEAASRGRPLPRGVGLPGRVWDRGEPAWVEDVTADPNFPRAAGAAQAGLRGACAVPVRLGTDTLGVLEFFGRDRRPPEDDLQQALSALAGQVGQFLERKRREANDEEQACLAAFGRDVGLALNRGDPIPDMLRRCAEAMVQHLHGAFARLWTLNEAEGVLELQASAGMYTHTDGPHGRVPLGKYEIGLIAQERRPHRTNAAVGDPLIHDQEWARSEGLVAFAGYPLLVEDRVAGVLALFARRPLSDAALEAMASVANAIALGVERKRAEEALREADRRKDEFLAMLAHELRNPLAPISNALHVVRLRGDDREDGVRQAWEIMERQVEHMVRLVDDLLDVGRITRGKIKLQKQPVNVGTVVARAVEGSRPLIDARRHRLEVIVPVGPLRVEGDPTRLAQVLWNLLNNSAKYTPEGGRITLAVERGRGEVALRVRDTGMGIPADALPTIFDLFTQAERTLDRAEGGLGIGLTLVRRLTELHGGAVEAYSEGPGRGSEFVVRLPLLPEEAPSAAAGGGPRDGRKDRPPPRRRVLVVDDNTDSAASLTMLLRLIGHEAHAAHDGREALGAVEAYRPELVLLDIGLPLLDGYEVARNIRAEAKYDGIVLAALTGYGGEEDRRRSQVSGFDHHLVKPVDLAALQTLLASLEAPPARQPAR